MVLLARDVAETEFLLMSKETFAFDAAKVMKEKRHGFVIVKGDDGKPVGIVTEWDYLSKIVAEGRDPSNTKLVEIMTPNVITIQSKEEITSIAKLMHDRGIRRLLVVEDGKILGIITAKTVLANIEEYVNRLSAQIARLQTPQF